MNNLKEKFIDKELMVRKKIAGFLEKLFWFCNYDLSHNNYKAIFYNEKECETIKEEKVKDYFDAYNYLLQNHKNPLSVRRLKKFFYLLDIDNISESILIEIVSIFFYRNDLSPVVKAVDFHIFIYEKLKAINEEYRFIISLMFLTYSLLKDGVPCFQINKSLMEKYIEKRELYLKNNKEPLYIFFYELISNMKYQNKDYYQNLTSLSVNDIYLEFKQNEILLKEQYGIKHLFLYGSYALNNERFDSDVDLFVNFNLDLTRNQKLENISLLTNFYYRKFGRFVDFHELPEYLNDSLINESNKIKSIF